MEQTQEVEKKAAKMGFIPKEDWKGDPDAWRGPEEFVERGENIVPIVKDRLDKALEKIEQNSLDMKILTAANQKQTEAAEKRGYEREQKDYDAKLARLEKREMKAFDEADEAEFKQIKKEKAELKPPEEPKPATQPKQDNIEFEDWNKKEPWYHVGGNDELTTEANMMGEVLAKQYPTKPAKEIYEMAAARVKKLHPDKFENENRNTAGAVEGVSGSGQTSAKTFAALPQSAKDSFNRTNERFKTQGRELMKKEQFLEFYNE